MNILSEYNIVRYFGNVGLLSKEEYKICGVDPLVSKEVYKAAVEKMEEYREQSSNKNLNDNSAMLME